MMQKITLATIGVPTWLAGWQPVVKGWLHSTGDASPPGSVAPRSNTPGILGRRALSAGRLAVSVRRQTFTTGC
jgi:hypothetical protein